MWMAATVCITRILHHKGHRLQQIQRTLLPMIRYRWSRWPFYHDRAKNIDKLQREIIAHALMMKRQTGQEKKEYHIARMREAGKVAAKQGLWSTMWARDVVMWNRHCMRGHGNAWPHHVILWRGPEWLDARRRDLARYGDGYWTTDTRADERAPHTRWKDGVDKAEVWLFDHDIKV